MAGFFPTAEAATAFAFGLERKFAGLKLKQQQIDGFAMPYLDGGRGEALVLLHGFGGDKDNFTRMAGRLTKRYRVVIPDLPGFGDAARDASAHYRMSDQVARVHAFCRALKIGRMILGGNSMGGFIAAQYAATYPGEVAALWLFAPAGVADAQESPIMIRYRETGEMPLVMRSPGDARALIEAVMARPPYIPGFAIKTFGRRGAADQALHARILKELLEQSPLLETQFASLPIPTLIVWGAEDKVLNPKAAATFQKLFPASKSILMPGIGHVPMMEAPFRTARDFLAWMSRAE
ncbi:alpha/beta hydrolase [Rhodoblastus sp.]|uniref:alpha/beta fold hydrolase n=1 Tax=Rhodoblastus sp. TaxID=1962975 RepID=UPI00260323F4|nr:alpha/beta hydrolase [Rhodoblastus sp.]